MNGTPITRTAFCQHCFRKGHPKTGDKFLVFGSDRQFFFVKKAVRAGKLGYTPHIFIYQGLNSAGKLKIISYCAMIGCDVEREKKNSMVAIGKEINYMTFKNWNALVTMKDIGLQI